MDELTPPVMPPTLACASSIVAAYVTKNHIAASEVPEVIRRVHGALVDLSAPPPSDTAPPKPAVPIKKSVTADYIVCLEDGKKLKMLKRYLRTRHNLTPDAYRAKWSLPADYPMVAPSYAAKRSVFAKKSGLGRRAAKPARKHS
jgi:predicted transcriptional regulator